MMGMIGKDFKDGLYDRRHSGGSRNPEGRW